MGTHRRFSPEFKLRVVMEVVTGARRPSEVCREQFPTVERAYQLAGAPDACDLFIHDDGHRYDQAAAIEWFNRE